MRKKRLLEWIGIEEKLKNDKVSNKLIVKKTNKAEITREKNMSDLSKYIKNLKFDKRMRSWNINQKVITDKEFTDHLEKLEDISHLKGDVVEDTPSKEEEKSDS